MPDKTHHIRDQFSDQKDRIDHLMAQDPEFLSMCEDYEDCVNALKYWKESNEPNAKSRINEYQNLVRELQDEIKLVLVEKKSPQGD